MSREIKTRQVHKDIKALDKTVTGMERVKRAYVLAEEDIIFFDWRNDRTMDHIGIVECVSGKTVNTIGETEAIYV